MGGTKENILKAALELFAKDGYEAVSVSEIAGRLGMTKGALYKHYKNKRDIFDSIIFHMQQRDAQQAEMFSLPQGTFGEMADEYKRASIQQIIDFAEAQFEYWTQEDFACCFRKMLTLEQYRNSGMSALYQQYICGGPLGYVIDLFGAIGADEPREAALALYAPMFLLYGMYDGCEDKKYVKALAKEHFEEMRRKLL